VGLPLSTPERSRPSFFHYAHAGLAPPARETGAELPTPPPSSRFATSRRRHGRGPSSHRVYIASRDIRKIEPADSYTALAISGTAARGIEFIRMAQLSFEHYEKMTDSALSLEGKANYSHRSSSETTSRRLSW